MDRADAERIARLEERINSNERALDLQAKEYQRRLDDLNHDNHKRDSDRANFVTVERFNGYVDKMSAWQDVVNENLSRNTGRRHGSSSLLTSGLAVIAVIISLLALASRFI